MALNRYKDAETDFNAAVSLRPKKKKTWFLLASARRFQNNRDGVVHAMENIVAINPASPGLRMEVAQFYYHSDYLENASDTLESYLTLVPDDHRALFFIGYIAMTRNKPDTALDWYIRSYKAAPENLDALNQASDMLLKLDRYDDALDLMRRVTKNQTGYGVIELRARVYEAAGWCSDAAFWYRRAAEVSPWKMGRANLKSKADDLTQNCRPPHDQPADIALYSDETPHPGNEEQ